MNADTRMAYKRLEGILRKVTYKVGWELCAGMSPSNYGFQDVMLDCSYKAPDVCDANGKIDTVHCVRRFDSYAINAMTDGQIFDLVIGRTIREAEEHEFKEWFRIEGLCVFNPHP